MKRFTVSLPDDRYAALRERGNRSKPPASLQQMVRFAVDTVLDGGPMSDSRGDDTPTEREVGRRTAEPSDLLVFTVGEATYGLPTKTAETVEAGLRIHPVPTTSASQVGVVAFRGELPEVHDGGLVLQGHSASDSQSMIAISSPGERLLMTVTSVAGLSPAAETKWAPPPHAAPGWLSALAWTNDRVIAVIDPQSLNL